MKREATLLLTILYAIAVIGISMSVHYCGKRIRSVSFGAVEQPCCCKKDMKGGCCHTKIISGKVTDSHAPAEKVKSATPGVNNIPNGDVCANPSITQPQPKAKSPSPYYYKYYRWPMATPQYIRNRVLII